VLTIGALAALAPAEVTALLGVALGTELHGLARGVDRRPVAGRGEAKQVSAETTFDVDLSDLDSVHRAVAEMTASAHRRLLAGGRGARTVTVKVRGADFATRSRSETTATASTDLGVLSRTARRLTEGALPASGVRLIGVSLSGLTDFVQERLFEADEPAAAPDAPAEALVEDAPADPGPGRGFRAGDDVRHPEHGHGWVQGSGHGRVTVRFETRGSGPGPARTLASDDPDLTPADPLASLG
jgi:DNA polymerase IV